MQLNRGGLKFDRNYLRDDSGADFLTWHPNCEERGRRARARPWQDLKRHGDRGDKKVKKKKNMGGDRGARVHGTSDRVGHLLQLIIYQLG